MKRGYRYTNIIIAQDGASARRIRIPSWQLPARKFGVICLFLCAGALAVHQISVSKKTRDYASLKEEHAATTQNFRIICDAFPDMDATRERLDQIGYKLRFMTSVSDPNRGIVAEAAPADAYEPRSVRDARDACRDFKMLQAHAEAIAEEMLNTEEYTRELMAKLMSQHALLSATPRVRPTNGLILSGFGNRLHPIDLVVKHHDGIDIAAPEGTAVEAPGDGTIIFVGEKNGYGNTIEIRHRPDLVTRYGHLSRIDVKRDQKVKGPEGDDSGTKIGEVGSTGKSTGPHLHYETHINGNPVDPTRFILNE